MTGPVWLSWPLAALMAGSALYHLARLVTARHLGVPRRYDGDATHLVMSLAMAAMLVVPLSAGSAAAGFAVLLVPAAWFARGTLHALVQARSIGQPARQLAMGAAMLFMLGVSAGPASAATGSGPHAGMAGMHGMAGMPGSAAGGGLLGGVTWSVGSTAVGLLVVLALVAAVQARELQVAVTGRPARVDDRAPGHSAQLLLARGPGLACQLAMSVAMAYMLALMLG